MSTAHEPDRFTTLPDDETLAATVVALEEHGFSVELVDDLEAARDAVLARIPKGSSVMTNTSVTLQESGIADAIDGGGPYDSARNGTNSRVGEILEIVQVRQARIPRDVAPFDEDRNGTFASSGDARFELRCTACGYGVVVRTAPNICPMCRGSAWDDAPVARAGPGEVGAR